MRPVLVLIAALVTSLALACGNDDGSRSSGSNGIPTPAGPVIRQSCDSIAATDYFLNDEERTWFTKNCNRLDCASIRGTQYISDIEREWFLANCL